LTWNHIVTDLSNVTPCSGLVATVLFTSDTNVLALSTPTLVWKRQ
jgi:hypothetical protein